jgi:hypothetical protein
VDRFVKSLPEKPELYKHLFGSFPPKDGDFLLGVLNKARELSETTEIKIAWKERADDWNRVAVAFWKDDKKGLDLFKAWTRVDYVQRFVKAQRDVKEGLDPLRPHRCDKQWRTLAHMLADCKREDLLGHLLETFPDLRDVKVCSLTAP